MSPQDIQNKILHLLSLIGFPEDRIKVTLDEEHNKLSLYIDDDVVRGDNTTPRILSALNHLINQILKKEDLPHHVVDLNYYRKEREHLITELARASAKKVLISKEEVELPPMNAYERRVVHMEVASHPELVTESRGLGKERKVIIKALTE